MGLDADICLQTPMAILFWIGPILSFYAEVKVASLLREESFPSVVFGMPDGAFGRSDKHT